MLPAALATTALLIAVVAMLLAWTNHDGLRARVAMLEGRVDNAGVRLNNAVYDLEGEIARIDQELATKAPSRSKRRQPDELERVIAAERMASGEG